MRTAFPFLLVALVLFVAGAGLWTIGRFEQQVVGARQQLLTLDYRAPSSQYDRIEQSVGLFQRVPWVAGQLAYIRALRATSKYWQRDYPPLALERDAGGALVEHDPTIMRLAANAAFRRARANVSDRATAQRLNDVLGIYAEVLKRDPEFDVAFNYELVARLRDGLSRRGSNSPASGREKPDARPQPADQTLHGRQGATPEQSDMREFKIIVPQRTDERAQQPDAGTSGRKPRKG